MATGKGREGSGSGGSVGFVAGGMGVSGEARESEVAHAAADFHMLIPNSSHAISCHPSPRRGALSSQVRNAYPGEAIYMVYLQTRTWSPVRGRETAPIRRDIPRGSNGCAGRIGCADRPGCAVGRARRGGFVLYLHGEETDGRAGVVADGVPELDGRAGGGATALVEGV